MESGTRNEVLIGQRIKVSSAVDSCFYSGTVDDFNPENNTHKITCDSGEVEILCLDSESWETISNCSLMERVINNNNNIESDINLGPLYYDNSNIILTLSDEEETSSEESSSTINKNKKFEKQRRKIITQQKCDFQSYKELIEHWKIRFTKSIDKNERIEYLKLIEELYEKHKDLFTQFNYHYMLNYDTTKSSSSSNSDNQEDLNVISYKSDEENTSTDEDENIEIPEPMDTDQIDPYGKRKLEPDIQKDDYLRALNKDFETIENTTRIFGNQTENIATNEIKTEYTGESSNQQPSQTIPIPHRIDDLNKRNVAQGGIYLDLTNISISDYEKTIDDWAQSMTIVVNNNGTWSKENFLNDFVGTFQGHVLQFLRRWEESEVGKVQKEQLINQIGTLKDLLKGLTNILKTEFCGYFDKKDQDQDSIDKDKIKTTWRFKKIFKIGSKLKIKASMYKQRYDGTTDNIRGNNKYILIRNTFRD
ncbi:hypothetical protein PVK06_049119 [Gossypium arboreum]|uniref:Uncharacterized protein n=1 Tax=Gossypium arboreum TaxID=29729 RepID=A0ABR0MIA3_GOSAR|nr:hypothetical protein PVK06_049119 [Gossypium arboreum]